MIIDLLKYDGENRDSINFNIDSPIFSIDFAVSDYLDGNFPQASTKFTDNIQILYRIKGYWKNYSEMIFSGLNNIDLSAEEFENKNIELLIYFPILANLEKFNLILPENSTFNIISDKKNVLTAGGVHSFGMGCTAPGTKFSNILSRKLNLDNFNLTFYDRNFLDKINNFFEETEKIPIFDYGILELDFCNQDDFIVERYIDKVLTNMLNHCKILICWYILPDYCINKKNKLFMHLEPYLNGNNLLFKDFSFLHNNDLSDMCSSSNNFLNDNGNILIYKRLFSEMRCL